MSKKLGFKKEKENMLLTRLFLNVFAEEPTEEENKEEPKNDGEDKGNDENKNKDTHNEGAHSQTINYEDLISRARKEEKEKLYPKIKSLEVEVKKLVEKNNNNLILIEEKEKVIEQLKEETSESDKVKTLNKTIESLNKEIENLKKSQVNVEDLEDKIKAQYEVKLYRLQKLQEVGSNIIPELVTGTTKEEIDVSLDVAKQRYAEIKDNIYKTSGAQIPSPNVDTSNFNNKDISIEDISKMDVGSPEYLDIRKKLGLR